MGLIQVGDEPFRRIECPGWSFVVGTVMELRRKRDMLVDVRSKLVSCVCRLGVESLCRRRATGWVDGWMNE